MAITTHHIAAGSQSRKSNVTASVFSLGRVAANGFIGFSNYPSQLHRKLKNKGFHFTIMVVGESGLGKTTLMNALFNIKFDELKKTSKDDSPAYSSSLLKIEPVSIDLEENGIKLKLTVIDTPGFGCNIASWKPILENILQRYDDFIWQEISADRSKVNDNRIDALIYCIPPNGHSLRPIDIEFMKNVSNRVNLIPIIAKADTITDDQLKGFKQRILEDLVAHNIKIFSYVPNVDDDSETVKQTKELFARLPFAVISSEDEVDFKGQKRRGRQYPWGFAEVDNDDHNDFLRLRQMIVRTHLEDLRETTDQILYEKYRAEKLQASGVGDAHMANYVMKLDERKRGHDLKLRKMEDEMKKKLEDKLAEKTERLRLAENEIDRKTSEFLESRQRKYGEATPADDPNKVRASGTAKGKKWF